MNNLFATEGKTFLVTGGASGLGAQYVENFIKEGAKAVAILDVQVDNGNKLAERLNNTYSSKVIFIKCDVSNKDDVNNAFDLVLEEFKQLDVIINNAGIMNDSPASWRSAIEVNWNALVDFTLKGIKHMRKDNGGAGGTIINKASITGLSKFYSLPIYCGSKLAVIHFSQTISGGEFFDNTGVRILTVCLGATATPLLQGLESRIWDKTTINDLVVKASTPQKAESAVAAVLEVYKKGPNGSIWVSVDNKPAKNITTVVDRAFTEFDKAIFS